MPSTCTVVSICVNRFRAKFVRHSHEINIHGIVTCVLACGCECELHVNFANLLKIFQFAPEALLLWHHDPGGL